MQQNLIHKVHITPEAVFDYEECMELGLLDRHLLKEEVEKYIKNMTDRGEFLYSDYLRYEFYDKNSKQMLMIFIYRAEKFGIMQTWRLEGICKESDYDEELEDFGVIRAWLKKKIKDITDVIDCAVRFRVEEILNNSNEIFIEDVIREVKNAFNCERDKEIAEKLALLQGVYFGTKKRMRTCKKIECH